jgi:hypothetical protein
MNALMSKGTSDGALKFENWSLPLPSALREKAAQNSGVTAGFRPEKGKLGAGSENNALKIPARLQAQENFGHEFFYHFQTPDGQKFTLRSPEKTAAAPDAVYLNPADLYFFGLENGKRI